MIPHLISTLAKDLAVLHGKGFSASNVKRFRQFYLTYPIGATLSHQLITEEELPSEQELENHLCNNLQQFLLELGKGSTYVGRQYRMTINNKHYRVDPAFYHQAPAQILINCL